MQFTLQVTSEKCHQLKKPLALAGLQVTVYKYGNYSACPTCVLGR